MEITLEKIELVKDRTGVSYAEAKEALEAAEGSVVDAIISIEETIDRKDSKSFSKQGTAVLDNLKDLVKKGNVSKILVKRDDEVVLNIPVNLGIIGTVIAPWGAVLGVVAAFGFKCTVEVIKDDGTIIDVSDTVSDTVGSVVEKGSVVADEMKEKGADLYQDVKEKSSDIYQNAKAKASEAISKVKKDKEDIDFSNCFNEDEEAVIDDEEAGEHAADTAGENIEETKEPSEEK
ncbi:MAG: DUF4342 domain-containing protein [Firmicutes bacterium]|jgi:polyhydroxyalkanoate synthesis regulator phasin|nr:DUF4342 domain-containing protein [Bacillota bacterium]NBI62133.1 DUF4342 domain-containing protein [Clostridiales bacterium]